MLLSQTGLLHPPLMTEQLLLKLPPADIKAEKNPSHSKPQKERSFLLECCVN